LRRHFPSQAPLLAAKVPEDAFTFMYGIKAAVRECSPIASLAVTGSSVLTYLAILRRMAPNDFALWDATRKVVLGQTPSKDAARAMAGELLAGYGKDWPAEFKAHLNADKLVEVLSAAPEVATPRPALAAYFASLVGGQTGDAVDVALRKAWEEMKELLLRESAGDMSQALMRMSHTQRALIRKVADGKVHCTADLGAEFVSRLNDFGAMWQAVIDNARVKFTQLLCDKLEEGKPWRLLPPHADFIKSMVRDDGMLLYRVKDGLMSQADSFNLWLSVFHDQAAAFGQPLREAVSTAVMESLASNNVGIADGTSGSYRPPRNMEEVSKVPGLQAVLASASLKPMSDEFNRFLGMPENDPEKQRYFGAIGFHVLRWLRITGTWAHEAGTHAATWTYRYKLSTGVSLETASYAVEAAKDCVLGFEMAKHRGGLVLPDQSGSAQRGLDLY